jgi:transcriptional regulator of aromatic amino acid metabolism
VGRDEEISADFDLVCASNLDLPALRERLDADFFDRTSHLTVTVPPLRDCCEDLPADWSRVWREMCGDTASAIVPPWNGTLHGTTEQSRLRGNLRDLQRLALLLLAWEGNEERAIDDWRSGEHACAVIGNSLGTGTRRDRINRFCGRLAQWAHGHFGNWQVAAKPLGCDEKTIRTDAASLGDEAKTVRVRACRH